ncbi:MAG TPA: DUF4149 domain-containing protein [Acidobacteriaceae bacterium]|nr:DUF4149 domain-containing protein [Acidobacteriaceae bacterium]
MRTLVRTIAWLALIVWLGGLFFFPIVAAAAFTSISDTHAAGTIVAKCLGVLHHEGLIAGCIVLLLLLIGRATGVYAGIRSAFVVTLIMMGLTAFSQYSIIPHMERDRIAAGGAIDNVPRTDPRHADFDRLHNRSVHLEEAVMLLGIVLVILLAAQQTPEHRELLA